MGCLPLCTGLGLAVAMTVTCIEKLESTARFARDFILLCTYSRTGGSFAASSGISCEESHGLCLRCHVEHLQGWWVRDVKGSHLRRVGLWKNCGSLGRCGLRQVSKELCWMFIFTHRCLTCLTGGSSYSWRILAATIWLPDCLQTCTLACPNVVVCCVLHVVK